MRISRRAVTGSLFVAFLSSTVLAADVASLQFGDFTPHTEGLASAASTFFMTDDRETQLSMTIDGFEVSASGEQTNVASNFAGHFEVAQPRSAPVKQMLIDVSGLVIKTPGATAQIDLKIGGATRTVVWSEADNVAQPFTETISVDLPEGRLPSPFPVEAVASVKRAPDGGSVLVSLKGIKVRMGGLATASVD